MGNRLTTVFVRQGHYAFEANVVNALPPADLTIDAIGDMLRFDAESLEAAAHSKVSA